MPVQWAEWSQRIASASYHKPTQPTKLSFMPFNWTQKQLCGTTTVHLERNRSYEQRAWKYYFIDNCLLWRDAALLENRDVNIIYWYRGLMPSKLLNIFNMFLSEFLTVSMSWNLEVNMNKKIILKNINIFNFLKKYIRDWFQEWVVSFHNRSLWSSSHHSMNIGFSFATSTPSSVILIFFDTVTIGLLSLHWWLSTIAVFFTKMPQNQF